MSMLEQLIKDAAEPLTEAVKGMEAVGMNAADLVIQYRREVVHVALIGEAAERSTEVWELLTLEFRHAGWGYRAQFRNGIDAPRTSTSFDHPITLTRH